MSAQYQVNPDGVGEVAQNLLSLISEALSDVVALEGLAIAVAAFAGIGSTVAAADLKRHAELARSLLRLMKLFQEIVSLVQRSANDYRAADEAVSRSLSGPTTITV